MDFIVPLLEDLGMAFVEIGATFIDHLDQFAEMEIETKELTDRAAARFVEGMLNYADKFCIPMLKYAQTGEQELILWELPHLKEHGMES